MKLSIGLAVYNVQENFLRVCIEGIIRQLTDDVELLLIDDCSTDNSGEICKEYAENNSRVRYIRMEENGGLSRVRNRTTEEAKGKWICFADGDDILSDYYVKTALSFSDEDYDIIIYDKMNFAGEKGDEKDCDVKELCPLPKEVGREISLSCLCIKPFDLAEYNMNPDAAYHAAWGALFSRDFLLRNNLMFPEGQKKAQDAVFNTASFFYAEKIAYLPYTMYYYRKNLQGITQRYSADFTQMAKSLVKHDYDSIEKLYKNDAEVLSLHKKYKMIALVIDNMRLNFFHKDNPKPREVRKSEFIEFINSEPFKSAILDFDLENCDWWGWRLPVSLAKKENFDALDFAFGHGNLFRIYGALDTRLKRAGKLLKQVFKF